VRYAPGVSKDVHFQGIMSEQRQNSIRWKIHMNDLERISHVEESPMKNPKAEE
jgi:hypothetical protein